MESQSRETPKRHDPNLCHYIGEDLLGMYMNRLLDESYVQFDGKLFKQISGIFMGMSPAQALANMCAFWYEFAFLKRAGEAFANQTQDALPPSVLRHYIHFTKRYVDDIIHLVDSSVELALQGLGPLLKDERESDRTDGIFPLTLTYGENAIENPIVILLGEKWQRVL